MNKITEVGQSFIIRLVEPYKCLVQINGYQDETIGEDTQNYFCKYFRWSIDNKNYSEFIPLTNLNLQNLVLNPENDFWIEYKYEACELDTGKELEFISIALEAETDSGIIEQVVQTVCCEDPWENNGIPNLTICDDCNDNLFNPYDLGPANNMYTQLSNLVNNIFGHCVKYYKVDPNLRTKDVILNEYTLHSVTAVEEIKIMIPDNELPSEEIHFDESGMGFDGFEVHITYQAFQEAFGAKTSPNERDFIYIPRIDKMFQVNSVALADEFNNQYTYWRVRLVKWEDRVNVDWDDTFEEQKNALKNLVVNVDDIFNEEKEEEYLQVTKPQQFKTIGTESNDFIRSDINADLLINDYNLNNNWTIVSKHYYDLTAVKLNNLAVRYRLENKILPTENRSFTFWFKWASQVDDLKKQKRNIISVNASSDGSTQFTTAQKHRYSKGDTVYLSNCGIYDGLRKVKSIIDLYNFTIEEEFITGTVILNGRSFYKEVAVPIYGYNLSADNTTSGMYIKIINGSIIIKINEISYLFNIESQLNEFNKDRWYALVINLNNQFKQLGLYLYELYKPLTNSLPQLQDTRLDMKFSEVKVLSSPVNIDSADKWMLLGSPIYLTNFRIFNTCIEEEQHSAVLNQYVVRDSQYALLVDNAQPQLRTLKLTNPR